MRRVAVGAVAALALLGAGYDLARAPAGGRDAKAPRPADAHERGRAVYNFRCYFCHGYSGDARTLAASYLSPPPRDFTAAEASGLDAGAVAAALRSGRAGTAMKSFTGILDEGEIRDVSTFVVQEFIRQRAPNTAYHTAANGWPDHQRYAAAFPFARGDIALDVDPESLTNAQRAGRRLFMGACVTCHDRARVDDEGPAWSARPVSYPRFGFVPGEYGPPKVDAVSSASVYAKHDVVPRIDGLSGLEIQGQDLFQANCAFCHGADGTGKNWIGQFMEPKARDLTQYTAQTLPAARLEQVIREGLPGTSMPAWQHVLDAGQIRAIAAYVQRAFLAGAVSRRP